MLKLSFFLLLSTIHPLVKTSICWKGEQFQLVYYKILREITLYYNILLIICAGAMLHLYYNGLGK